MALPQHHDPNWVRMEHSVTGGEEYTTLAAYRDLWYDLGWRSPLDDPAYVGGGSGGTVPEVVTNLNFYRLLLVAVNSQADNYTLVLTDASKTVEGTKATAMTLTIPENATVPFPVGTTIEVYQAGAGQITVAGTGAVVVRAPGGAKTRVQYSTVALRKRATDEWVVAGDTAV